MTAFYQKMKRHEVTGEYSEAFSICLENIKVPENEKIAIENIRRLVKQYSYKVFKSFSKGYSITIKTKLDENWILDIAINNGYNEVKRSKMSISILNSVPCITLGSFMAKHKYGLGFNKDNSTTIYYHRDRFCDDFKMIDAITEELIKLYKIQR